MTTRIFGIAIAGAALAASSQAFVSLEFRPLNQVVNVGDLVQIELFATTTNPSEDFVAIDTILLWTNSVMNPVGANQSGGAYNGWTSSGFLANEMNLSLSDGNALWTGLGPLVGTPPSASPSGTKLTTFTFTAIQVGTATLSMPASFNWPGRPVPFESKVYGPQLADLTGSLAPTATVQVVPEPATVIALGTGALALLRRRRKA